MRRQQWTLTLYRLACDYGGELGHIVNMAMVSNQEPEPDMNPEQAAAFLERRRAWLRQQLQLVEGRLEILRGPGNAAQFGAENPPPSTIDAPGGASEGGI